MEVLPHQQQPPSQETEKQIEFYKQLKKIGSRSSWFFMIWSLICVPNFCYVVLNAPFANILTCDFKYRCRIPELKNNNWTFEQILRISTPADNNCVYYKYNYTIISKMTYDEAVSYVDSIDVPKTSSCYWYEHKGCEVYPIAQEFSFVCNRKMYEDLITISLMYGKIVASLFLAPLGDIFGRKRLMEWGADMFLLSGLAMCLANTAELIVIFRVIMGLAYTTMIHPMEAIVIELSNSQLRPFRFLLIRLGTCFGFIVMSLLGSVIWHWRLLLWAVYGFALLLPLTTWYVPESPRWLLSKGKKAKALAILRTVKDPVTQSELLILFRNEKTNYVEDIRQHLKEFRPFIIPKLLHLTVLFCFVGSIFIIGFSERYYMHSYVSRPMYLTLSGAAEIFGYMFSLPLLMIFGRRATLMMCFLCGSITYALLSQLELERIECLILLLIIELSTTAAYGTLLLFAAENVPTSHRCTGVAISNGLGIGLSVIVMFHIHHYVSDQTLFIICSCTSLAGIVATYFVHESKSKSLYDSVEEIIRPHSN